MPSKDTSSSDATAAHGQVAAVNLEIGWQPLD